MDNKLSFTTSTLVYKELEDYFSKYHTYTKLLRWINAKQNDMRLKLPEVIMSLKTTGWGVEASWVSKSNGDVRNGRQISWRGK